MKTTKPMMRDIVWVPIPHDSTPNRFVRPHRGFETDPANGVISFWQRADVFNHGKLDTYYRRVSDANSDFIFNDEWSLELSPYGEESNIPKNENEKFLVDIGNIACSNSILSRIIVHTYSIMGKEKRDAMLELSKKRSGKADIRIVIEGEEFTFKYFDSALFEAWNSAIKRNFDTFIENKADEIHELLKQAINPFIEDFFVPEEDV